MANSNERVKYYRIGEFAAIMMLKGIIHPDMQENNLGIRNGVVVTNDFADVKFFDFPEGINSKVVKQLVDALFPPMERILKDFKLMSSFRAGFISVGGLLGKTVFDELDNNGVNSFCYAPKDFDLVKKPAVNIDLIERNKRYYADWKNIIISGDLHDTQYSYEQNFLDCFYNRSCVKGCLGFGPRDFLKAISKSEDIPDELVRLFTNASFYSSLLSVLGDRYRSIPNIKGIGFKTLIKSIEGGMKEKKINNETRSAMLLASIFPEDIQATMYNNLLVTDVQNEFDMLTDGDRKTILGQIIDRSDITALQLLNRTRFRNNQLRLEALLK